MLSFSLFKLNQNIFIWIQGQIRKYRSGKEVIGF